MKVPTVDLSSITDMKIDDSTTSIIITIAVVLVVFMIFKKLFRIAMLVALIAAVIYFLN